MTERRSARVGQPFTIRLRANPTTGFGWQAVFDGQVVALVDKTFELGSGNVGGGGEEVLTFRPLQPGRVTITVELKRPWEKSTGARESRVYEVSIEL